MIIKREFQWMQNFIFIDIDYIYAGSCEVYNYK